MDHQRNTHMMRSLPKQQYLANGALLRSLSRSFVSDGVYLPASARQHFPFNLHPSIDVDHSLSNVFSLLNLSPTTYTDRQVFLPKTLDGQIGRVGSSIGVGEGFIHLFGNNTSAISLEEGLRVLNDVNNPQTMHSGVGLINPFTVDPRPHRWLWNQNTGALQGHSSSEFDIDQKSHLVSTKYLYSTQQLDSVPCCSSNHGAALVDQTCVPNNINNKSKFQRSNEKVRNPCYNSNHICGVALSKLQKLSLKELRGRISTLAMDPNGCRILQAMFEAPTVEEVEIVLSEVVDSITDLMKDQVGNYLVQKLVAVCNDDQKMQILLSLTKVPINIILVCMSPHGTRAVQKLLENLNDPNQVKLIMRALHRGAATLANDPNGHHVIQYCLVHFHSDINKPILTEIADECFKVATDRSGCCVLQACVEHSRGEVRNRLVTEIMANSIHLAEDPFGNYVLQHMLGLNIPVLTTMLVRQLQGNFASLSCNKYASNVVEKCLNESGEDVSTQIILELIRSPNSPLLLVDPYANFVIQSALKVSKGFAHDCLCDLISKNISTMRSNLYGKKILEWLEKRRIHHA